MKILVLGKGYLGAKILDYFVSDYLDKRIEDMVKEDFDGYDVVINTIAKTNVDWCETNDCHEVNTVQASRIANLVDGKYVFISTGCIFPVPMCEYSWSKYFAELRIVGSKVDHLILRPRLLISFDANPRNTITKILKYPVLSTAQESMTIIEDFLLALRKLLVEDAVGIYNVVNEGTISPSEIATIFGKVHTKKTHELINATSGKAPRTTVIMQSDVEMPNITTRIREIKEQYEI